MKKISLFILPIILFLTNISQGLLIVKANTIQSSVKSDYGYYVNLASSWSEYVTLEKETLGYNDERILEKTNFYYVPKSTYNKKVYIMTIFVFYQNDWKNYKNAGYSYLSETSNYVFALKTTQINPFSSQQDKSIFNRILSESQNLSFVKSMITIGKTSSNLITVNGTDLLSRSLALSKNSVYLPIRETCEALGYGIVWNPSNSSVSVIKASERFYITLRIKDKKSKYNVVSSDGKTYVGTLFFLTELKASVEIDKNNNVTVTK